MGIISNKSTQPVWGLPPPKKPAVSMGVQTTTKPYVPPKPVAPAAGGGGSWGGASPTTTAPVPTAPAPSMPQKPPAPITTPVQQGITTPNQQVQNVKNQALATKTTPNQQPVNQNAYTGLVGRLATATSPNKSQTGILSSLRDTAQGNQGIGQEAQRIAQQYGTEIARVGHLGAGAVAGDLSTGTNVVGSGNAAIASQSVSARMQALANAQQAQMQGVDKQLTAQNQTAGALSNALTGANTQQGQAISGLGTAAGLVQPVQVPYGNQYVDPQTGQAIGGGSMGGAPNIQSLAQQVISGQLSPSQADAMLQNNLGLTGQLNQAILSMNPQFNRIQAEANAGAQGQALQQSVELGGNLQKRANTVNEHLLEVQNSMDKLNRIKLPVVGNVPIVNTITNYIGRGLGNGDLKAFDTALSNARGELAGIFAIGSTPTEGETMARTILPDNITPDQLASAIKQAKVLVDAKVAQYSNVGTVPQFGGQQNTQGGRAVIQTSAGAVDPSWFND